MFPMRSQIEWIDFFFFFLNLHHHINPHPPCSFFLTSLSSTPGFLSISILLHFISFLISKAGHSRRCRLPTERDFLSGFLCVFVHHPPAKAPQASCEAVGSIHPGGLFFIVIHPRDCSLLVFYCMPRAGCHCEEQMPR